MKFKVGDIVKVRNDLQPYKVYFMEDNKSSFKTFYETMQPYCGRETEVIKIDHGAYLLACDKGYHLWSDGMLREYTNPNYQIMITNDEIKIYKNYEAVYYCSHKNFDCKTATEFIIKAADTLKEMTTQKVPFSGKVICLAVFDSDFKLTPGKVYEIKNGELISDDLGYILWHDNLVYSLNDITVALFVELEEYIKYLDSQK